MTDTGTDTADISTDTSTDTSTDIRKDSRAEKLLGGFASPLQNPRARLLFLGQVASRSSSLMFLVALAAYALTQHHGASLLAEVLLAQSTAALVILLLSGAVTDRVGARAILLVADATRCL